MSVALTILITAILMNTSPIYSVEHQQFGFIMVDGPITVRSDASSDIINSIVETIASQGIDDSESVQTDVAQAAVAFPIVRSDVADQLFGDPIITVVKLRESKPEWNAINMMQLGYDDTATPMLLALQQFPKVGVFGTPVPRSQVHSFSASGCSGVWTRGDWTSNSGLGGTNSGVGAQLQTALPSISVASQTWATNLDVLRASWDIGNSTVLLQILKSRFDDQVFLALLQSYAPNCT